MIRKKIIYPLAIVLAASFCMQSCIGSFSLTNKVLRWNRQVSNKFINELVFFAFWVLPVYEVTAIADLLVINSIEFWSGNNPMEANNRVIDTEQGKYYIAADQSGYSILSPNGDKIEFIYDSENNSWSLAKNDEKPTEFLQFVDDSHVKILGKDGDFVDVELSREGVDDYILSNSQYYMAMR
ncbi:MAG: DUF3332 domain-containing protein [Muribaculaceae bacterium]|nr:DUF3332 domain-containing protein [Muribaculaceae bacterium]